MADTEAEAAFEAWLGDGNIADQFVDQAFLAGYLAHAQQSEARVGELTAEVEALRVAISWVEPPFVGADTPNDQVLKRLDFMLADVARFDKAALSTKAPANG